MTWPLIRASFLVTRPITVRNVTLLPEPDSPTTPSVSPGEIVSDTTSTALTRPSSVGKWTLRSLISRIGSGKRSLLLPDDPLVRIEGVAQPVPQEIHAQHGDQDEQAREPHQPRRQQRELLAIVEQVP